MRLLGTAPILIAALGVSACANMNSISRTITLNPQTRIHFSDAKQRAILASTDSRMVCAEPSPDALASYAAALQGSLTTGQTKAGAAASFAETAASIGLRTQSIQLLRDFMYRDCEAGLNGLLDNDQYVIMQRRFQTIMVGLLAIEQLTGATVAQQAVLETGGQAGVAGNIPELQSNAIEAHNASAAAAGAVAAQQTVVDQAKATHEAAPDDAAKKQTYDTAVAKLGSLKDDQTKKQAASGEADSILAAAMAPSTSVLTHARFANVNVATPWDAEKAKALAETVARIVEGMQTTHFASDQCEVVLSHPVKRADAADGTYMRYREWCLTFLADRGSHLGLGVRAAGAAGDGGLQLYQQRIDRLQSILENTVRSSDKRK